MIARTAVAATTLAALVASGCGGGMPPEPPPPPGAILPTRVAIVAASLEVNRVTVDRCAFRGLVDSDRRAPAGLSFGMVENVASYAKKRTRLLGANLMVTFIFERSTMTNSVNGVGVTRTSTRLRGKAVLCPPQEFELILANAVVLDEG